jgi:hypothetical protein
MEGEKDGDIQILVVGVSDGLSLGTIDGISDGALDGDVGTSDGLSLGTMDGISEGNADGNVVSFYVVCVAREGRCKVLLGSSKV